MLMVLFQERLCERYLDARNELVELLISEVFETGYVESLFGFDLLGVFPTVIRWVKMGPAGSPLRKSMRSV